MEAVRVSCSITEDRTRSLVSTILRSDFPTALGPRLLCVTAMHGVLSEGPLGDPCNAWSGELFASPRQRLYHGRRQSEDLSLPKDPLFGLHMTALVGPSVRHNDPDNPTT